MFALLAVWAEHHLGCHHPFDVFPAVPDYTLGAIVWFGFKDPSAVEVALIALVSRPVPPSTSGFFRTLTVVVAVFGDERHANVVAERVTFAQQTSSC